MRAYLITGDVRLFESLERYFTFIAGEKLKHIPVPYPASPQDHVAAFHTIADSLEEELSKNSSSRAPLVIVDTCFFGPTDQTFLAGRAKLSDWNPLHNDLSSLYAMFLLAYPEVHWVFYTHERPEKFVELGTTRQANQTDQLRIREWQTLSFCEAMSAQQSQSVSSNSSVGSGNAPPQEQGQGSNESENWPLKRLLEYGRLNPCFLFDATGLRNYFHGKISNENKGHFVRQRDGCAAAIDEEEPYVFLHGYLAYKLGYRVHLVTTEKLMTKLFGKQGRDGSSRPADMTFQDIFLNFPDHIGTEPQSDLQKRFREDKQNGEDPQYPLLAKINTHIFVSVGHRHSASYEANRAFFRDQRAQGKKIKKVFKPSGGTYNLLKDAGLLNQYWKNLRQWIKDTAPPKQPPPEGGHSAPGRLVVIAERLNDRAEKILEKAQTVQECILGATLALEASELLGYRTPTTALESIALRHQLEVKAECMFYGVGYNIDVKSRLKEIEMEVKAVARWFHGSVKKRSLLNAQLSIITEIARIFRDHGQFDEEQVCLRRLRDLNRQWYFLAHPWFSFFWPIRWYVEKLVGSFPAFVTMVLAWPFVFGVLSSLMEAGFKNSAEWKFWDHVAHAYFTFFGLQPLEFPADWKAKLLAVLIVLTGFLHLGIFIAHLYTLIMRR
jgi:hypothetical protein